MKNLNGTQIQNVNGGMFINPALGGPTIFIGIVKIHASIVA